MIQLSAYLNLLFEEKKFADRIDNVAKIDFDGFELFGWDHDFETIRAKRDEHNLEFVCLSGERPDLTDPDRTAEGVKHIEETIELAAANDCQRLNVKAGTRQPSLVHDEQQDAVIDALNQVEPLAAEHGVTLVLEPLNTQVDHPDHFLTTATEAAPIIEAVDSSHIGLLFDVYHEQIMDGDVIRSFRQYADIIHHVHIADNPGRHEPGTGELNYDRILNAIAETGYDGYVGFEFTPTRDPIPLLRELQTLVYD